MAHFAAWYRREDYDRVRSLMDDGNKLPATFEEWEKTAKSQVAAAAAQGVIIEPVILDPDKFVQFCKDENHTGRGNRERGLFAVARGTAKDLH
jgi:hypothetical protein